MTDAITTLVSGLQQSTLRVNQAAEKLVEPQNFGATKTTPSGQASDFSAASIASAETLAGGSLEAAAVSLKIAAHSYKANAEALTSILENQKEAFDRLI